MLNNSKHYLGRNGDLLPTARWSRKVKHNNGL